MKKPQAPSQSEAALQAAAVKYFAAVLPKSYIAIHVPNEGRRTWAAGKRMKAAGLVAGVPDFLILGGGQWYGGKGLCYGIELKSAKGRLSPAQAAFHDRLAAVGVPVAVCKSLDEIR